MLQARLWKKQPGQFFCISTKSGTGKWKDNWFSRAELGEVEEFIQDNTDKDVYACPHGFSKKSRLKEYAIDPLMLYADLDECDPRKLAIRPTIAIESSPGRYVGYWLTNEAASEELNRRLSYSINADVSGWDRTQVLRVPNTRNYKYDTTPKVRLLWSDGPQYEVARLEKMVPAIKSTRGEDEDVNEDVGKLYKKYEKKLPIWVRRELLHGKPSAGKRSEVLWKLQNELLEVGMSRDDAFELLWASPWNKFKDRRNGEDQLWRELDKSVSQHFTTKPREERAEDAGDPMAFSPLKRSIADVDIENIDWIVPGWFARQEVTIVEGDPGLGKSYFVQMVAGAICDGVEVPCETKYTMPQGRVAYFDTENTASTVTKSRLVNNKIHHLENYWQEEDAFSVDDEERWSKVVDSLEELQPTLIVFDTINLYIGGADTYKSSETQQALSWFKKLAVRFNCPVVLLRHLTKSSGGGKALYRGQGSIAFTGTARIVLSVGLMPDDDSVRIVGVTKNNLCKHPRSLTYTIESLPDTLKMRNRSRLVWGEFVDMSSDDFISAPPTKEKNKDKDSAMKWLKEELSHGDVEIAKVEVMAEARGFSRTVINRAATELGVTKKTTGFGKTKKTLWSAGA